MPEQSESWRMEDAKEVCRRLLEMEAVIRGALITTHDADAATRKLNETIEIARRVVTA
jgi:hypothetical protein